ncbi:MAG: UPF0175 family protein [Acidobacteriaceae bacterium]|nr:UPF0175 family protein [Acidobacteriaceae bacterium]
MPITLHIPDSVMKELQLPEGEIESRLRIELAIALYQQGTLSLRKACELATINQYQFGEVLGQCGIARHYGLGELAEDVHYARS